MTINITVPDSKFRVGEQVAIMWSGQDVTIIGILFCLTKNRLIYEVIPIKVADSLPTKYYGEDELFKKISLEEVQIYRVKNTLKHIYRIVHYNFITKEVVIRTLEKTFVKSFEKHLLYYPETMVLSDGTIYEHVSSLKEFFEDCK